MTSAAASDPPLLEAREVHKHFPVGQRTLLGRYPDVLHAVDGVSLEVRRGETLGLVGETGCGKSTLARCITRLYDITAGEVWFEGRDISRLGRREMRPLRREMQMIFQDPYGSLNPRRRVGSIIGDPFAIHGIDDGDGRKRRVQELMELVGLNPEHYNRFPAEFSGGQRQRIGVARALALRPRMIVCDEPVSALDVSIQAQVLNLLVDLQRDFDLTYVFITHDLSVVRHVSDRIAVMYLGKIVEIGAHPADLHHAAAPLHPRPALRPAAGRPGQRGQPRTHRARRRHAVPGRTRPRAAASTPGAPRRSATARSRVPPLAPVLDDAPEHRTACFHPLRVGEDLAGLATPDRGDRAQRGPGGERMTVQEALADESPTHRGRDRGSRPVAAGVAAAASRQGGDGLAGRDRADRAAGHRRAALRPPHRPPAEQAVPGRPDRRRPAAATELHLLVRHRRPGPRRAGPASSTAPGCRWPSAWSRPC